MKKTIKLLGFVLGLTALFTACADDNDSNPVANTAPKELVLNTPAASQNYIQLSATNTVSFSWNEADFGYSALATYRFQVGLVDANGNITWDKNDDGTDAYLDTPYSVWNAEVPGEEIAMSISHLDGFKTLADYADKGVRSIAFRLYGCVRSGEGEEVKGTGVYSNSVIMKQVQSYAAVKAPKWIYLVGNCTNWYSPDNSYKDYYDANWRVTETAVGTEIYRGEFDMPAGDLQFRFYKQLTGWEDDSMGPQKADAGIICAFEDGKYEGKILSGVGNKGSWKFEGFAGGKLEVTVNMNTNKVSFVIK